MLDNFCKEQIAVGHARGPAFDLEEIMFHLDRFVMNDATAQVTEAIADSPDLLRKALHESSGWCKCRDGWQIVDEDGEATPQELRLRERMDSAKYPVLCTRTLEGALVELLRDPDRGQAPGQAPAAAAPLRRRVYSAGGRASPWGAALINAASVCERGLRAPPGRDRPKGVGAQQ